MLIRGDKKKKSALERKPGTGHPGQAQEKAYRGISTAHCWVCMQGQAQESPTAQTSQFAPKTLKSPQPPGAAPSFELVLFQCCLGAGRPGVCVIITAAKEPFQWTAGGFSAEAKSPPSMLENSIKKRLHNCVTITKGRNESGIVHD